GDGPAAGAVWEEHFSILRIRYRSRFEILEHDVQRRRMVVSIEAFLPATQVREVAEVAGGSRLSVLVEYSVPGGVLGRLADAMLFRRFGRDGLRKELRRVRDRVESADSAPEGKRDDGIELP
ncbi:MAG: hypothetical protein ACREQ9_25040, partial [Candidatus Binatia bacterium]